MFSTLRQLAGITVLLGAASVANAGPIKWSYRIHSGTANGSPYLNLGTVKDPSSDDVFTVFDRADYSGGVLSGTRSGDVAWSSHEYPITVGGAHYPDLWVPAGQLLPDNDSIFRVSFAITDLASGQMGQTVFDWNASANDGIFTSGTGVVYWHQTEETKSLVLGGNRYDIRLHSIEHESWSQLAADVHLTAATPEPATIALAGIGVAGIGLLRTRRMRSRCKPLAVGPAGFTH